MSNLSDRQVNVINLVARVHNNFARQNNYEDGWVGTMSLLFEKINRIAGPNQKLNLPKNAASLGQVIRSIPKSVQRLYGIKTSFVKKEERFVRINKA